MDFPRFCRTCGRKVKADEAYEIENNTTKPEIALLLKRYVPEMVSVCLSCQGNLTFARKMFDRKDLFVIDSAVGFLRNLYNLQIQIITSN